MKTNNYELLIEKIDTFTHKYYLNRLLRGLIILGACLFSAYIIIVIGEYFASFSVIFRTILFYSFIALTLILFVLLVLPPIIARLKLGKSMSHDDAAEIIGKHFSDVNDKLLNTLQLKKLADDDPSQQSLIQAGIEQNVELLKPASFSSAIKFSENIKYLKWAIVPIACICIVALTAPSILTDGTKKLIRHNEYFASASPFKFVISNPSLSALQGDDFSLKLSLIGDKFPTDVYLETQGNTFKLDKDNINRFHYVFNNLQQNVSFKLIGNDFYSQQYLIKVNLRPSLLRFDARLNYPNYLHKKTEIVSNAGDLNVPAGTTINWNIRTQFSTNVLFYMNAAPVTLSPINKDLFEHIERVTKNATYKIVPSNSEVNKTDGVVYNIKVLQDEFPVIAVQEKPDSISLKSFYFTGRIQDDHGFSTLKFHYETKHAGDRKKQAFDIPLKIGLNEPQLSFFYFWDLKKAGVTQGDQLSYYFEVSDNDAVTGPKRARTPEKVINVPDATAINSQLNAGTQAVEDKMKSAAKTAGQIERQAQKISRDLLEKNTLSFDEKKQIEQLLLKRQELDALVKDIQTANKKNLFDRQENQQQSKELAEKQRQMDRLLSNMLDKDTQEMLKKLQLLMDQGQKNPARDELSTMQSENKSLKKDLERMLELYKKLEFDQKLNQNLSQLNELAEKEQQLVDETQKDNKGSADLQQRQQNLKNKFDAVKKSFEDLKKDSGPLGDNNRFEEPKTEEQGIDQEIDKSLTGLQQKDFDRAVKAQRAASTKMKELANKLKQSNDDGEEKENNINAGQLRELIKNLVNSSFEQEKVMQFFRNSGPSDPNYVTLTQQQKGLKDNLKTAEDSLYALSKRVPQIQSAVNKEIAAINGHIDKALDNLAERRTAEANRDQQYAMTSMNNLALLLSEALQQLQNSMKNAKTGNGKQKKLSLGQLSKMQQQLNQNMKKMRDQLSQHGREGSAAHSTESEQLAKMARQQQLIRQSLQQINSDENKDGRAGFGDLNKISHQMEQTENDLVNRKITDEALKRQQLIESRLLDAEKAEQQREQDQKRESNAGNNMPPGYIKALQEYKQLKGKQTEQIKTVSPALNLYYKEKIKTYFDQLNVK